MDKKPRILVVDDEPELVEKVSTRLKAAGYEILTAGDGQQALDRIKQEKPELVILDLILPKLDGYKVCRLLKFDKKTRTVPVIIFTVRAQAEDIALATECGADAYITKPFEPQALLDRIEKLLEAGRKPKSEA